jgi:hypothetical protein
VREPGREREVGDPSHSDPFVWVFDPTASIVGHLYTQWLDEHPPLIASLYYASALRMLAEGRIEAVELAAFVNLNQLPQEVQLAVEGGASREAAIRGLSRLPPERLCKAAPWIDPELARFQGTDQAIAAGIRYAARRVVVVSRSRQPLGREVVRYAAERGVEIARVPTDGFAPARLERYRWHHFVPAGGDAYRPPPAWCRRFVSPV